MLAIDFMASSIDCVRAIAGMCFHAFRRLCENDVVCAAWAEARVNISDFATNVRKSR